MDRQQGRGWRGPKPKRTFDRATFESARDAWTWGRYDPAIWSKWRGLAQESGIIFPPAGTPDDDPESDDPSIRALVYRAIRDMPITLEKAIARSGDWGQVLEIVLAERDRMREDIDLEEKDAAWERAQNGDDREGKRRAAESLAAIVKRLGDVPG